MRRATVVRPCAAKVSRLSHPLRAGMPDHPTNVEKGRGLDRHTCPDNVTRMLQPVGVIPGECFNACGSSTVSTPLDIKFQPFLQHPGDGMGLLRLAVCVSGVYAAFLLWAVAQERREPPSPRTHRATRRI